MHSVKAKIHQNLISETIVRSPPPLRICICVCICICVIVFVYLHFQICAGICTVIVAAWVFLSKQTSRRWSIELHFSQPDFVFVTGSFICISHELTLYFSPKFFISQRGIILEPAAGFAFSKGQNPSDLNFQSPEHIGQPWKSFAAVLGPI